MQNMKKLLKWKPLIEFFKNIFENHLILHKNMLLVYLNTKFKLVVNIKLVAALFQYYPLLYLLDREQNTLFMFLPVIALLFLILCYAFFRFSLSRYKSIGS